MWNNSDLMSITTIFKLFRKHRLINHQVELKFLAESAGLSLDKGYLRYKEFVGLFAKPVLYSALANLTYLLVKGIKCTNDTLAVQLNNYQREIYLKGLKEHIDSDTQSILNNAQALLMIDKKCNDMNMYCFN